MLRGQALNIYIYIYILYINIITEAVTAAVGQRIFGALIYMLHQNSRALFPIKTTAYIPLNQGRLSVPRLETRGGVEGAFR